MSYCNLYLVVEETPKGFPQLAAFQSSEANFSLYRSFSYLHARVLLDLQDEITSLEKELDEIDKHDAEYHSRRLMSRELDIQESSSDGENRNRRVILGEIKVKLMEYGTSHITCICMPTPLSLFPGYHAGRVKANTVSDKVLIKARTLESFQKPSDRNYRSVRRFHHNTDCLMDAETDSIRSKEDVVSLINGREWATFDGGVENMIGSVDQVLQRIFRTERPPLQV